MFILPFDAVEAKMQKAKKEQVCMLRVLVKQPSDTRHFQKSLNSTLCLV